MLAYRLNVITKALYEYTSNCFCMNVLNFALSTCFHINHILMLPNTINFITVLSFKSCYCLFMLPDLEGCAI